MRTSFLCPALLLALAANASFAQSVALSGMSGSKALVDDVQRTLVAETHGVAGRLQRGSAWERWVLMGATPSAFGRQMQHPGMACVKVAGMGQQPCAVVGERGVVGAGRQGCPPAQHLATRVEQEVLAALVAHGDEALVG